MRYLSPYAAEDFTNRLRRQGGTSSTAGPNSMAQFAPQREPYIMRGGNRINGGPDSPPYGGPTWNGLGDRFDGRINGGPDSPPYGGPTWNGLGDTTGGGRINGGPDSPPYGGPTWNGLGDTFDGGDEGGWPPPRPMPVPPNRWRKDPSPLIGGPILGGPDSWPRPTPGPAVPVKNYVPGETPKDYSGMGFGNPPQQQAALGSAWPSKWVGRIPSANAETENNWSNQVPKRDPFRF